MKNFSKEEIVYRACKAVVQLIRNHVEEGREGIHSRLFSYILHPERNFVCVGQSVDAMTRADVHPEHVVPCAVLIKEVRRLLIENLLSDEEIARLLQKHWKIVLLSKEQAKYIDYKLGYKSRMPAGWTFEIGDPFARLREGNILLGDSNAFASLNQ